MVIASICVILAAFGTVGATKQPLDLYVIIYDLFTSSEAQAGGMFGFQLQRQTTLKNFLIKIGSLERYDVSIAMSKCDGNESSFEHVYFVDKTDQGVRVYWNRLYYLIDPLAPDSIPASLLNCLDHAMNFIFNEEDGGARSGAKRVLLIIHRSLQIVLNNTFYEKMQMFKDKTKASVILAVNTYPAGLSADDDNIYQTFTTRVANELNVDRYFRFSGRSADELKNTFVLVMDNPAAGTPVPKGVDCTVGYRRRLKYKNHEQNCTCVDVPEIIRSPTRGGKPCAPMMRNRTSYCHCAESPDDPFFYNVFTFASGGPGYLDETVTGPSDSDTFHLGSTPKLSNEESGMAPFIVVMIVLLIFIAGAFAVLLYLYKQRKRSVQKIYMGLIGKKKTAPSSSPIKHVKVKSDVPPPGRPKVGVSKEGVKLAKKSPIDAAAKKSIKLSPPPIIIIQAAKKSFGADKKSTKGGGSAHVHASLVDKKTQSVIDGVSFVIGHDRLSKSKSTVSMDRTPDKSPSPTKGSTGTSSSGGG